MFFERFLKPKWQHPNPKIRRQSLLKLDPAEPGDADVIVRLACEDSDPEVRRSAIRRVSDLMLLDRCAQEDPNAGVREVAGARYRQLLAGGLEAAGLAQRLEVLQSSVDDGVLSYVARRGREPELRYAAVQRLAAIQVLEEVTLNDSAPKVRQAALARIEDEATLERIAGRLRERDRKLARAARDRLEDLAGLRRAAERARQEYAEICTQLEELAAHWNAETGRGRFLRLQNRWERVEEPPASDLARRYAEAGAACEARLQAAPPSQAEAAVEDRVPAQPQAGGAVLDEQLHILERDPRIDEQRLNELRRLLSPQEPSDQASRHARRLLEDYLAAAERFVAREAELSAAAAGQAAGDDPQALQTAAKRLRAVIEFVAWRSPLPAPEPLEEARRQLARLDEAASEARTRQAERHGELERGLEELEKALKGGQLKPAQRHYARVQRVAEGLPPHDRQRLEGRLRRYGARLAELKDWRRFATLPKQEALCAEMEALVGAAIDPPELAKRIKQLQTQWKDTGGSDSAEARALWERFRSAADAAFEPCRAYFDALAQQRELNLQERGRITEQLEGFLAAADWERLEAKGLAAVREQARREWLAAAPVPAGAEAQKLEKRFEGLMDQLSARLEDMRRANEARKAALIEEANRLAMAEDPRQAAERAKALQAQWREIGPAAPARDRRLWGDFRRACDAVFARRDEARAARDAERSVRLEQANALCRDAEALADSDDLEEAKVRAAELEQRLAALGAVPKDFVGRMEQAVAAVQIGRRRLQREHERAELRRVRDKAVLCAELEVLVQNDPARAAEQLDVLEQRWQAAPEVAELAPRWQQAEQAARSGGFSEASLAANERARRALCVRLELAAGLESPPEDEQLRMNLQIDRLNKSLAEGVREDARATARAMEREWLVLGAAPAAVAEGLERRFEAALARLE